MREITHITCSGVDNVSSTQCNFIVIARCIDNTIWRLDDNTADMRWVKLPNIPDTPEDLK
jgi:hypothetical protein